MTGPVELVSGRQSGLKQSTHSWTIYAGSKGGLV